MITVQHPDGSFSRIPVQNGGVTIAMGDRIIPTQEALCMDVCGDQPKQEDWTAKNKAAEAISLGGQHITVTRDASNTYQPENAHLHAITTSLQPSQVLALVKAETDALKLALFDHWPRPLEKLDVQNRLHEIVRLVKLLPEGRLP